MLKVGNGLTNEVICKYSWPSGLRRQIQVDNKAYRRKTWVPSAIVLVEFSVGESRASSNLAECIFLAFHFFFSPCQKSVSVFLSFRITVWGTESRSRLLQRYPGKICDNFFRMEQYCWCNIMQHEPAIPYSIVSKYNFPSK